MANKWTKEQEQFLKDNVKGISEKELTERFNKHFNLDLNVSTVSKRKSILKLSNEISRKGKKWDEWLPKQSQINSSRTQFKKGVHPHNYKQIGEERIRGGYQEIKIDSNNWKLKQRYIYEKEFGEIPDGCNIVFLDGNKNNLDISNLALVKNGEFLIMKQKRLLSTDKNITKTGSIIANVIYETRKRGKYERET